MDDCFAADSRATTPISRLWSVASCAWPLSRVFP